MTEPRDRKTPNFGVRDGTELHYAIRELLPHRSFSIEIAFIEGAPVLKVRCRCDRALAWYTSDNTALPDSILAYWLADHDDDMFLTDEQQAAKYGAQIPRVVFGSGPGASSLLAQISAEFPEFAAGLPQPKQPPEGGRPLAYDPDQVLGERP